MLVGICIVVLKKKSRLNEIEITAFAYQIAKAIAYLHKNNIVHHDLSLENLMISKKNIKLIDFGFCVELNSKEEYISQCSGSEPYVAPEVLNDESYLGPPVDVWSFGVILFVLICNRFPFNAEDLEEQYKQSMDSNYILKLLEDNILIKKNHKRILLFHLLKRIFVSDPQERIVMRDVLKHPWFLTVPCCSSSSSSSCSSQEEDDEEGDSSEDENDDHPHLHFIPTLAP